MYRKQLSFNVLRKFSSFSTALPPQGQTHQKRDNGQPDQKHGEDFPTLPDFVAMEKDLETCAMMMPVVTHEEGRLRENSPYSGDPQPDAPLFAR